MASTSDVRHSTSSKKRPIYEVYKPRTGKGLASALWKHFHREKNGQSAKCVICDKIIQCSGATTTGLKKHLEGVHKMTLEIPVDTEEGILHDYHVYAIQIEYIF